MTPIIAVQCTFSKEVGSVSFNCKNCIVVFNDSYTKSQSPQRNFVWCVKYNSIAKETPYTQGETYYMGIAIQRVLVAVAQKITFLTFLDAFKLVSLHPIFSFLFHC